MHNAYDIMNKAISCSYLLNQLSFITQFRGSEIIELQNFKPASVDDIASVHARAYVSGLEKVASKLIILVFLLMFLVLDYNKCQKLAVIYKGARNGSMWLVTFVFLLFLYV
jgi:hypothetical protein